MAIAVIIVMAMGEAFTPATGSAGRPEYSGQQLLDLANESTDSATINTGSTMTTSPHAASTTIATDPVPAAPITATSTTAAPSSDESAAAEAPATTTAAHPAPAETTAGDTEATSIQEDPTESANEDVEARGHAALATISYPWQQLLPEWSISFHPEKSGLYGLTMVPERKIEIYVRESQTVDLLAHVIAHELGHAVDVSLNDGPDRRRWEHARGLDSAPWWPGSGATDFSTGAGDFAESFAAWQVGDESFQSKLGDAPTVEQIELLAELSAG